jgi:hypothetical protein
VIGAAGVGKTSLIQAGMLPALVEGEWLTAMPKLDWSATPPKSEAPDLNPDAAVSLANPLSRQLIESLVTAANERRLTSPEYHPGETLWEFFHRAGNRWWSARQRVVTPIIIVDEFESIFTTATQNATAERQAAGFLRELSQLAANRPPSRLATKLERGDVSESAYDFDSIPLRIVLIVREEFASQLTRLRPLFPTLRRSELRLEAFTTAQARDVLMRGAMQGNLMSDAALDAVVAQLADRGAASEISPARLNPLAHALAAARRERGATQITPDFLPKADRDSVKVAETSSNLVVEAARLREKLTTEEGRRRRSQRLASVSVLVAAAAIALPIALKQFVPDRVTMSNGVPTIPPIADIPTTPPPTDQSDLPESPFSTASPEYLPVVPTVPPPVAATPEPQTSHPAEPVTVPEEPIPGEKPLASPPAFTLEIQAADSVPGPTALTPRPIATPAPGQSAVPPDVQRQLDAAATDRKEQQRREFLKRQQEGRRPKETGSRDENGRQR